MSDSAVDSSLLVVKEKNEIKKEIENEEEKKEKENQKQKENENEYFSSNLNEFSIKLNNYFELFSKNSFNDLKACNQHKSF